MSDPAHSSPSDSASTTDVPAGDPRALDTLYRRHWHELCAFVRRGFGPGPPDPEDAAQAAFTQFAALAEPSRIENPRAFLFRLARNFVLDFHRRQIVQRRYKAAVEDSLWGGPAQPDAQSVLEARERLAAVSAAVASLEPRRRKVLIWHTLHELSFAEIATRLGLSQTRVRQLFADALMECERAARAGEGEAP